MLFGVLKKLLSFNYVRIIILLLFSIVVAIIVNSMHSAELPLILPEGQRPGAPKGSWKASLQYVDLSDVVDEITAGQAILIDIRESEDFEQVHAVGSINLPYYEFDDVYPDFVEEVSTDKHLVIFGEGMLFGLSAQIARRLLDEGYENITILKKSFEDCQKQNLPIYRISQEGNSHEAEK
ncbi:rhodanese-like domain-containing protein [Planctomycetota bacterium]